MTNPAPTPRFCEQCGAVLETGAGFCESCGAKVPDGPESPVQGRPIPTPPLPPAKHFPPWLTAVVIASALLVILLIAGVSGWRFWKSRIVPVTTASPGPPVSVSPESPYGFTPPPPVNAPAEASLMEKPESARESSPLAEDRNPPVPPEEDPVLTWLETQTWFQSLRETMPPGVTLTLMRNEGNAEEDAGWATVEVREIHSPESGFDPDVAPLVGIFRVARDRTGVQWLNAVTGEWESPEDFLRERAGTTADDANPPTAPAPTYLIYDGDFEGEAPDGSPDPPVAVNDPLNPGNLVGLLKSPEPLRLELAADDASAGGRGPLGVAFRFYLPEIARSRDESGVRLRVSLIGEEGRMVHGELKKILPSDTWQPATVRFSDPPSPLYGVSVEAVGIDGAVFVDDLRFVP